MKTIKRRGIQQGQVATDEAARINDSLVNACARKLMSELQIEGLTFQSKLTQAQIISGVGSCQPDGGIFLLNGVPVAFFESKKQGSKGNAIERWYKNERILRRINPEVLSGTFCVGEGVLENGPIWKVMHEACDGDFNAVRSKTAPIMTRNSVFLSQEGFDEQFVIDRMRAIVMAAISAE
jgi:hypothetical protein